MDFDCTETTFTELRENHRKDEALVLLGCGGESAEWFEGVTDLLENADIAKSDAFGPFYELETTGGRRDLVMIISGKIDIGKLAIWRLSFGDCSWLSDYLMNYATQHECEVEDD